MQGEILFLCHRMPFPPDRGDKIRSWNTLKRLAQIAPVHVGCLADDDRDMSFVPDLLKVATSAKVLPRNLSKVPAAAKGLAAGRPLSVQLFDHPGLHAWVRETLARRPIATVFVFSGQMAQYVRDLPANIRLVMDFVDVDSAKFEAYGRDQKGPMGWVNRREGRVLADFERSVAGRADMNLFVSVAEATLFRQRTGLSHDRVGALENGVDMNFFNAAADFAPLDIDHPLIVFTGQMDYRPNIEAVDSFARSSLPAIRTVHPDARFAIVGRNPSVEVQALAQLPGVLVTGAVEDVRPWVAAADAVVAPLRIARGVQNKVLEAMAMARPVVASKEAAEGIDALDGRDLLVASGPAAEAAMVVTLLSDPVRAKRIGAAARLRVEQRYGWDAALAPLAAIVTGDAELPVAACA